MSARGKPLHLSLVACAPRLQHKAQHVCEDIAALGSAIVAFSAGVDSTLLLCLAHEALGDRCLAVTARSPSLAPAEDRQAAQLAAHIGVPHQYIETHELQRPGYVANNVDRCYHCKTELFTVMRSLRGRFAEASLLYGANADDVLDPHRPGHRAAKEFAVHAPLANAGLGKEEIRQLSRALDLPTWNKPQMACLASRFPYGTEINEPALRRVARAEQGVRALGFVDLRVRSHGDLARLELGAGELDRLGEASTRAKLAKIVRDAGFAFASVDLQGFRSGRMNDSAPPAAKDEA